MPRRVSLPGADELFRATGPVPEPEPAADPPEGDASRGTRTGSGRVRHDEKMTVYVTAEELMDLEHARLQLRREVGRSVDRGRLVRAAIALALAEWDEAGADSELVRLLRKP